MQQKGFYGQIDVGEAAPFATVLQYVGSYCNSDYDCYSSYNSGMQCCAGYSECDYSCGSNAGEVAGQVIGSIFGVCFWVFCIRWWCIRRRTIIVRQAAPAAQTNNNNNNQQTIVINN